MHRVDPRGHVAKPQGRNAVGRLGRGRVIADADDDGGRQGIWPHLQDARRLRRQAEAQIAVQDIDHRSLLALGDRPQRQGDVDDEALADMPRDEGIALAPADGGGVEVFEDDRGVRVGHGALQVLAAGRTRSRSPKGASCKGHY